MCISTSELVPRRAAGTTPPDTNAIVRVPPSYLASSTHEFNLELCRLSETCGVGDHTLLWCVQDESCRSVCGRVGSILELY